MAENTNPENLPQVVVTIGDDGTITATVDGEMFLAGPIDRDLIEHVTASIAEQHGGPVQVEIREVDGTKHTDVVTPPRRVPPAHTHPQSPADTRTIRARPGLLEVAGEGFIPGEDVAVAVIVRQSSARRDGRARGMVDRSEAPGGITDVILFGMTSGTLIRGGER